VKRAFAGLAFAKVVAGTSGCRHAIGELSDFPKNASTSEFPQPLAGDRWIAQKLYLLRRLTAAKIGKAAKIRVVVRRFPAERPQLKGFLQGETEIAYLTLCAYPLCRMGFRCVVRIEGVPGVYRGYSKYCNPYLLRLPRLLDYAEQHVTRKVFHKLRGGWRTLSGSVNLSS
jgi:hypothetical protein